VPLEQRAAELRAEAESLEHREPGAQACLLDGSRRRHHTDGVTPPETPGLRDRRTTRHAAGISQVGGWINSGCMRLPTGAEVTKQPLMRTSPAQIERVAATLVKRLVEKDVVKLAVPDATVKAKFVELLTKNFDQEAEIERLAMVEAEKLVRQGAPGVKREDLDLRRVEQLVKQRLAKARGFVL